MKTVVKLYGDYLKGQWLLDSSLENHENLNVHVILGDWNNVVDKLAKHARCSHELPLFHRGMKLPHRLIKALEKDDPKFKH